MNYSPRSPRHNLLTRPLRTHLAPCPVDPRTAFKISPRPPVATWPRGAPRVIPVDRPALRYMLLTFLNCYFFKPL